MKIAVYHPHEETRRQYQTLLAAQPGVALQDWSTPHELKRVLRTVEVLFCWALPPEYWAYAKGLHWVQSLGAGVEDLVRHAPAHVRLTRVEGVFGPWMAEYVFGHLLHRLQHIEAFRQQQAAALWRPIVPRPLHGLQLGVAGVGAIGATIARVGVAFGLTVTGWSRSGQNLPGLSVYAEHQLADFLRPLDVVVLALPLTPKTYHRFGREELGLIKPGAGLINIGRGALVQEAALQECLERGHLGWAVLDVFEQEPLPAGHAFWRMPQVTVTPHISGPSIPSEVAAYCARQLERYQAGEPLQGVVQRGRGY